MKRSRHCQIAISPLLPDPYAVKLPTNTLDTQCHAGARSFCFRPVRRCPAIHFNPESVRRLLAVFSLLLLGGCATIDIWTAASVCGKVQSANCYPVWYATNRKPVDLTDFSKGFTDITDSSVHYGKLMVPVTVKTAGNAPAADLQRVHSEDTDISRNFVDAEDWERSICSTLNTDSRDVVVFIHGYANTFDQTAELAANLGATLHLPGAMAFFSWPSRGWQDPLNYLWDLTAVENSEEEFAGFLARLGRLAGPGRVHIIAHSLGAYGFLRALQSATARAQIIEPAIHFGQIIFAAPDMDERLFRRLVAVVPKIAERITLYVADQDMAVFASEFIHGDQRIGLFPPVPIVEGIDTVEVLGRRSRVELGHSYFRDAPDVFLDIQTLIHFGEAPALREQRNGFPIPDDPSRGGAWVIRNSP